MNFFKQIATQFQRPKVDFSTFDMSHEHKTTMQFGKLCPVFCEEVLPGDKWHISPSAFARTMPLLSPMMHRVDLKMRFFFVPNRLVWGDWERFISQTNLETPLPTITLDGWLQQTHFDQLKKYFGKGSLMDYFGFRFRSTSQEEKMKFSQLPFRAYDLIYQEYFTNQYVNSHNVQNGYGNKADYYDEHFPVDLKATPAQISKYEDLFVAEDVTFEHDYFTSALPYPNAGQRPVAYSDGLLSTPGDTTPYDSSYFDRLGLDYKEGITANSLRILFRLQNWLENSLRGGQRYNEQLFSHFGVTSSDARLQRPEYLGGGSLALQISEVASTAETSEANLGDLAGRGISVGDFNDVNFTAEEHGYLFGLAYITPHSSYFGGIPRTFTRFDKFDFAFPEFAGLGEQPLYKHEVDASYASSDKMMEIFGYVPRYSEYKQSMDKFTGDFADTLAHWHLGRDFYQSQPALNDDFMNINDKQRAKLNRVFGLTDPTAHPFMVSFGFKANATRPLPFNPTNIL